MRIVSATGPNFSTFLAARMVFVTVLLGVAMIFTPGGQNPITYLMLFGANATLSLGCWEWYRRSRHAAPVRWVALTGAVSLDTLVLYHTGGADSVFVFLYFFSIGSAGILTGLGGSLWTAVLSSAGLVWLFQSSSPQWFIHDGLRAFVFSVNFFLTAILTAYVFEKLRERERTHQKTLGELEQIRLDTQAILDSLSTGVVVIDGADYVLYSNPAGRRILGLGAYSANQDVQELLRVDQPMGEAVRQLKRNENSETRTEIELSTSDSRRPIGLSISQMVGVDGETRGYIVLFSDLTKIKEVERSERERERLAAVGRLARELAHEIRNPLATVRGCVEMMRIGDANAPEMTSFMDLALRESDRLNVLLRDFLTFARLGAPQKQPLDLVTLIRKRLAVHPENIGVVDHLPPVFETEYDTDQILLVIDAILLSLYEWAEGPGQIHVETSAAQPRRIRFLLSDRAVTPEIKEAAFQPFSGVVRTFSGLALPTALRAIHAHGGSLSLESEPGVGTWFELTI